MNETPASAEAWKPRSTTLRISALLLAATLFAGLVGCAVRPTYISSPEQPVSLWVEEISTHKVLWAMDVPVQYKLVVQLTRNGENDRYRISGAPANSLHWTLTDLDDKQIAEDILSLPGTAVMLHERLRSAPEMPGVTPMPTVSQTKPPSSAPKSASPTTGPAASAAK